MKKALGLLIALSMVVACFAGCGAKNGSKKEREISAPTSSNSSDQEKTGESNSGQDSTADVPVLDEGTIASLDEIKQKLLASGYEISEMDDIQKELAQKLVAGFNFSKSGKGSLLMEFSTPNDAQAYADMVNEAGYNISIVNGRFLTFVDATKGVITDVPLQKELEELMDAKAQVQKQWSDTEDVPTSTSDYKSAFELMENVSKSMNTVLDQALAKNNNEHPEGELQNTQNVFALMFGSVSIALTSQFCEDEAMLTSIEMVADMMGLSDAKATRNAAHDYKLTAIKTHNQQEYEINAVYYPTSGGLRMVEKTDGKVTEFFEFIPLGGDQYAFQTDTERAVVNYKDGRALSFTYTKSDSKDAYDNESDSIYPSGAGASVEWIAPKGEDGYEKYFSYDGKNIKLSVDAFGERIKAEIPA